MDQINVKGTLLGSGEQLMEKKKSLIDFFIVCEEFFNLIESMAVDEERIHVLTH